MLLAPVTNWEPHGVTLAGYCYAMRHGMKVQIVTPYRLSHLQRYGVTVRGNVTSVYPPLACNEDGEQLALLKLRYLSNRHGIMSQKALIFRSTLLFL
jgi:hypothetical protein